MIVQSLQSVELTSNCLLDLEREELVKNGLAIALSRLQFRVLFYLVQQRGKPVSAAQLLQYAWGSESCTNRNELYVCINRIRNRLEANPHSPELLLTIRGVGYMLIGNSISN